ncbi:DUF2570 domain-containing protein [Pluralibacter sp.]|uniref:DUF2570 domain-containing protein n=1 Tax=Pluralibacter sp. TaxID=1920032 RepID=UPI0025CD27A3|nr:DUF2570 domain-containing protein [Pluralibacter sp.]MBV8045093.1 DUF2570 domain-containing protein [Pluralibacter sp.]
MNLTVIKTLIPVMFALIIIGFIVKLGVDNRQLKTDNYALQKESRELTSKNTGLANTLQDLTNAVTAMNQLADKEAKRRAAAEMKSQRLQDEIKNALKDNQCAVAIIPDSVVERLRQQADSARSHKGKKSSYTSKSSD